MNQKTKALWNQIAPWWDAACQEGDLFHRTFLFPTIIEWVAAQPEMKILDIGCGNGSLARRFTKAGADVIAADFSEVFIEKAQQRSEGLTIDYRVIDATQSDQLNTLIPAGKFYRIVCSMVLHDMPTITPLIASLQDLLKPQGAFIFSAPHPCFNSGLVTLEELKNHMDQQQLILPNRYIQSEQFELFSKPGQPVKQISFHRPLSELFNELFRHQLVMSGFAEPVAANADQLPKDFLWAKLSEMPPAIISKWELKVNNKGSIGIPGS